MRNLVLMKTEISRGRVSFLNCDSLFTKWLMLREKPYPLTMGFQIAPIEHYVWLFYGFWATPRNA